MSQQLKALKPEISIHVFASFLVFRATARVRFVIA
jgi:hypothetical protein